VKTEGIAIFWGTNKDVGAKQWKLAQDSLDLST